MTKSNGQLNQNKWDRRFCKLAKFVSQWSKDPHAKVGAVVYSKRGGDITVNGVYFRKCPKRLKIKHLTCSAEIFFGGYEHFAQAIQNPQRLSRHYKGTA